MEDFFRNKFVIYTTIIFGAMLAVTAMLTKDDISYQFEYSYTENIGNTKTNTLIAECVTFNSKKMTLKQAKTMFIQDKPKNIQLSVLGECKRNWLGSSINPRVKLSI